MTETVALAYFDALRTQDGERVRSLFPDDGIVDDFKGRRHRGAARIGDFVGSRPPLSLTLLGAPEVNGNQLMFFGHITYKTGEKVWIRWVLTIVNDRIIHVCNSLVKKPLPSGRKRRLRLAPRPPGSMGCGPA